MPEQLTTRRGVLAAGGAALLAGVAGACGSPSPSSPSSAAGGSAAGPSGSAGSAGGAGAAASGATSPGTAPAAGGTPAPDAAASPPAGPDILHGPRTEQAVALTFHGAGDPAITRQMLSLVSAAGGRITVLAIGQWLAANSELARTILDGGHDLGNHTWSHLTMPRLSSSQVRSEIDRAAAELRALTGTIGRWFRPSGTPTSTSTIRAAAVRAGYGACLSYDVDPMDYTDPGADAIVRRFTAAVRPGSIVSLHLGHPETLQAMPRMLAVLHGRGLAAVTATELLAHG